VTQGKTLTEADVAAALAFATEKHKGQFRIGGAPYITHPVAVAELVAQQGGGPEYRVAALFHDLLEDTDATPAQIEQLGGPRVRRAVELLTKQPGYRMEEYVRGIRADPIAFAVKAADRLHNLRCAVAADENFRRKYILETVDWYLDFSPEIREATRALAHTLSRPLTELSFLYEPIESWKLDG
jgi:(p)ppGpp synthase/HD superfamily hydrolase